MASRVNSKCAHAQAGPTVLGRQQAWGPTGPCWGLPILAYPGEGLQPLAPMQHTVRHRVMP
eukprot:5673925-Alexandrium_andersonii.AAC.1